MEYIESYARKFNVNAHVKFRHEVLEAKPCNEDMNNFDWKVTVRNLETHCETTERFDAVYVCTGHHGHKSMPEPIEGQDIFQGEIFHAHDFRSARNLEGKRVVIVGLGNSGADLSAELGPVAHQVYVALRRGTWVANRVGPWGLPLDHFFLRRVMAMLLAYLPYGVFCGIFESYLNFVFDHTRYRLRPEHRILSQHITVNDALPNLIISGRVKICSKLKRFTPTGVVFEDSPNKVVDVDVVIFATGYKIRFPYLPPDLIQVNANKLPLYKFIFPPTLPPQHVHTLAFLGLVQPLGPIMPMAELQARWAARLLLGKTTSLPSLEIMKADINRKYREMSRFYASERHTVSFDWIPYMDEVADAIGCRPPMWRYFFTDFRLWFQLFFGCAAAYQYRLVGPGAWQGARETILGLKSRIETPFANRLNDLEKKNIQMKNKQSCLSIQLVLSLLLVVAGVFAGYLYL